MFSSLVFVDTLSRLGDGHLPHQIAQICLPDSQEISAAQ